MKAKANSTPAKIGPDGNTYLGRRLQKKAFNQIEDDYIVAVCNGAQKAKLDAILREMNEQLNIDYEDLYA